jgi:O-antigen ligase
MTPPSPSHVVQQLRAAPAVIPTLVAVAVMVVWAAGEGGYPTTEWYPGGLILLGLLAVTASTLPIRAADIPRPVLVAAGALGVFTLWSFLSITWADAQAIAWEGANRTLVYLIAFLLFALWPIRGAAAALLGSAWVVALAAVAGMTLLEVATSSDPLDLFTATRLHEPAGYANATGALLLMPAWLGLVLASRPELPWWSRGVLAGAVVLLGSVAFMTQSRGAVYAVPIVLALMFAFGAGRLRTFATLIPIATGLTVVGTAVLRTDRPLTNDVPDISVLADLGETVALATVAVAIVIAVAALIERRSRSPEIARHSRRAIGAIAAAALAAAAITGAVVVGNPIDRLDDGWNSFTQGYAEPGEGGRLMSGLGSNRYDFYRVALDSFRAHPILGTGADNFQQDYLADRHSDESPRYPHSVELRTLSQTGLVGTLALGIAIAAALAAALQAIRRSRPLDAAVATGAATAFVYWLVHGSFDWFWEFAGLGVPAFAMLGLACGLARRDRPAAQPAAPVPALALIAAVAAIALSAISLAPPWLSEVETDRAAANWRSGLGTAYDKVDQAARLNPLADRPYAIGGTIALRVGDLPRARRYFERALERNPRNNYVAFELGAIASQDPNRRVEAERLLELAHRLNPRDPIQLAALARVRAGRAVPIERFNALLQRRAERLDP